jgi:hypothetical protein
MAASRQTAPARVAAHHHGEPVHRHGWQSGAAAPAGGASAIRSLPALGGEADAEAEAQRAGSSGRPSWRTIFKVLAPLGFIPSLGGVIAAGLGGALEPKARLQRAVVPPGRAGEPPVRRLRASHALPHATLRPWAPSAEPPLARFAAPRHGRRRPCTCQHRHPPNTHTH